MENLLHLRITYHKLLFQCYLLVLDVAFLDIFYDFYFFLGVFDVN